VAWYPIYRIPDAPLAAKFLTYHRLAPAPAAATHCGALAPGAGAGGAPGAAGPGAGPRPGADAAGALCLPIVGLMACDLGAEQWLERTPPRPEAATAAPDGARADGLATGEPRPDVAGGAPPGAGWQGGGALRARLAELAAAADGLTFRTDLALAAGPDARAGGLAAAKLAAEQFHADHNYFSARAPSL